MTLAGGLLTGLIFAAFAACRQIYALLGPVVIAHRWRNFTRRLSLTLVLGIGTLIITQFYLLGTLPAPFLSRTAEYRRICRAIELHYPYFELKGINWSELRKRHTPLIDAAIDDRAFLPPSGTFCRS